MDDFDEDDTYFAIDTETAWEPLSEFWDCILKQYEGISYVYIAEEPGFRLYINTDVSGDIFPDRFIFYNDKGKNMYFKDVIELIKYVNKYLGKTFNSFEEIKDYINELKKSKHNMCIDVYKFLEK